MGRIRLFPLLFQNGCSQSSRFPTAGQGERGSGNEIAAFGEMWDGSYAESEAYDSASVVPIQTRSELASDTDSAYDSGSVASVASVNEP